MSIKVMNWAWEHSRATGGDLLVLLAIADHASDDGTNAYPHVDTLAGKCRMSHRSIQRALARLVALGELAVDRNAGGQPSTPAFWRPNRYTVLMNADGATNPGGDNLTPGDRSATPGMVVDNRQQGGIDQANAAGVVVESQPERGDNLTPLASVGGGAGVTSPGDAGGTTPGDGAVTQNRPNEPSQTNHHPDVRPIDTGASPVVGGEVVEGFFTALGTEWRLSVRQRRRLAPRITSAVGAGWSIRELITHVGANTAGVRNHFAVLQSRLTDLPAPPRPAPARPAWCGQCEQRTRLREDVDGRLVRCPACHPLCMGQLAPARQEVGR